MMIWDKTSLMGSIKKSQNLMNLVKDD